jgi:hypothetical protein
VILLPLPRLRPHSTRHKHRWRKARHLVDYSPHSYRWCRCGVIQVLTFSGWHPTIRLTPDDSPF